MGGGSLSIPGQFATALVSRIRPSAFNIKTDPAGVSAILSALNGGPGHEWVNLIRRQVPNYLSVFAKFASGQLSQYSTPGVSFQLEGFQSQYTGTKYDQLSLIVGGVGLMRGKQIELGTITRGLFHDPDTSYFVFAINRGKGASLGPTFPSVGGITPDALVTIQVGPFGGSASGTVKDLVTGATRSIDSSKIQINGATLRVFIPQNTLPQNTKGIPFAKYRFAVWTQNQPGNDITSVGSFIPATTMNRVGILSK